MTILLSLKNDNKGMLNILDENTISIIKNFLPITPNEKFVKIHDEMKLYDFKPYRKTKPIMYRRNTNFSMGLNEIENMDDMGPVEIFSISNNNRKTNIIQSNYDNRNLKYSFSAFIFGGSQLMSIYNRDMYYIKYIKK